MSAPTTARTLRPVAGVRPGFKSDLRDARASAGLTQLCVATAVGVSQQKYARWEGRDHKDLPNAEHLRRLPVEMRRHLRHVESVRDGDQAADGLEHPTRHAVVARELSDVIVRYAAALADGSVSRAEAAELVREIREARAALEGAEAGLSEEAGVA